MVPSRAAKFASVRSSIKTILNRQNKLFNSRTLYSDRLKKMKEKQAFFQRDDGVPVYLKAGTRDKILYNFTLVGVTLGLVGVVKFVIDHANKL